jgi:hypothetical protein
MTQTRRVSESACCSVRSRARSRPHILIMYLYMHIHPTGCDFGICTHAPHEDLELSAIFPFLIFVDHVPSRLVYFLGFPRFYFCSTMLTIISRLPSSVSFVQKSLRAWAGSMSRCVTRIIWVVSAIYPLSLLSAPLCQHPSAVLSLTLIFFLLAPRSRIVNVTLLHICAAACL